MYFKASREETLGRYLYCAHQFCLRAGGQCFGVTARFLCFECLAVFIANLPDEAIVDINSHHRFADNDFLFVYDHFFDQRVHKFFREAGNISVLRYHAGKRFGIPILPGIAGQQQRASFRFSSLRLQENAHSKEC